MSQDEAARDPRNPDHDATPAADERPRPRYGEYAPPGWTWQPPVDPREAAADAHPADAAPASASAPAVAGRSAAASPQGGSAGVAAVPASAGGDPDAAAAARPVRVGDLVVTVLLLVVGLFGAAYNALLLAGAPSLISDTVAQSAEILGRTAPTEPFVAGQQVPTIIAVSAIGQLLLWAAALAWSIIRLRARRIAFWVPLLCGVLAALLFYVGFAQIMLSDPTYAEFFTSVS